MNWPGVWQGVWEGAGEPGNPVVYAGLVVGGVGSARFAAEVIGLPVHEPETLFARMWRAGQQRAPDVPTEAPVSAPVEPKRIEAKPDLTGAMAEALAKAEIRERLAHAREAAAQTAHERQEAMAFARAEQIAQVVIAQAARQDFELTEALLLRLIQNKIEEEELLLLL